MEDKADIDVTKTESLPADQPQPLSTKDRLRIILIIVLLILVLAGLVVGAVFLFRQDPADTSHIRDIFIIFIALEALVIGVALVILMVQMAMLINLLQHEIKPILQATNETANTLRGTAAFLSENVSEPVIKLNEYMAAIKKLIDLVFHPGR